MKPLFIFQYIILALLLPALSLQAQLQTSGLAKQDVKKVAILPMVYISEGAGNRAEEMRYLQNITHNYLKEIAGGIQLQDPAETNALLLKHNIQAANIKQFTPKELAVLLHVNYVLTGTVVQERTGANSSGWSTRRRRHSNQIKKRGESAYTHQQKTTEDIDTQIAIDIYADSGKRVYSKSRKSIWSTADSYKNGIQYLIKRSPLYKK